MKDLVAQITFRRELRRLSGARRHRPRPLPKPRTPVAIQSAFFAVLRAQVRAAGALIRARLFPALPGLVAQAGRRGDAGGLRADAWQDDLGDLVDGIAEDLFATGTNDRVAAAARDTGKRISAKQRDDLRRQFAAQFGFDPLTLPEPWLAKAIDGFARENVDLITTVEEDLLGQVRSSVTNGVRIGRRHEDIAKDLEDRLGVSESRAALIARDQVLKFQGDLNRTRQQALGLARYTWRTAGDDRVRDEHHALNRKVCSWTDPPLAVRVKGGGLEPGHPGDAVNCRCTAEPVLDDLFEELE